MPGRAIRRIVDLRYASRCERPITIPHGRPRGAKRHGLNYERDFAEALGASAIHGQWFAFRDGNGAGHCQTDVLLDLESVIIIFECKYTWVPDGAIKMEALYRPVVEQALGKPTLGIVVCKKLLPRMGVPVTSGLLEAIDAARPGRPSVLHWIGVGAIPGAGSPILDKFTAARVAA